MAASRRTPVKQTFQALLEELESSWRDHRDRFPLGERGGDVATAFSVTGLVLRVEGPGELVDRLIQALGHHPSSADPPDLTIRLWGLGSEGSRPRVAGSWFQATGKEDWGSGEAPGRVRYDWPQRILQAWDAAQGVAWCCIEDTAAVTWWEEAAPFRPILAWWLAEHDRHFAHGAALAVDGRATLLVGPGGSGKSTTALRAQRAGLDFLGDDYCLVAPVSAAMGPARSAETRYQVASLYRSVKLRPVDGGTEHQVGRNEEGHKVVLCLDGTSGGPVVPVADLVGVASVSVGEGSTTTVLPADGAEVLRALAPTSVAQLPGAGSQSFAALAEMVRCLPTTSISLGTDPDGVVAAVRRVIERPI